MAFLGRDDFFKRIHDYIPDATSDNDISFLEDITDTYNDMDNRANSQGEDWEKKYNELNETWKKRYQHRFYNGPSNYVPKEQDENKVDGRPNGETITVEDLFKE